MRSRVSTTWLGIFVVGAIAILFFGISQFGRDALLGRGEVFVLYFSGSMKGLHVGSPVTLRGLKIGEVVDVNLRYDKATGEIQVPVYIQFIKSEQGRERSRILAELIVQGLRAQLQINNLLTGELGIDIGFYPDTPIVLVNTEGDYLEIPTIPSVVSPQEMLQETLEHANVTLETIREFVTSPEIKQALLALDEMLGDARLTINTINDQIEPVIDSFVHASAEFAAAAASVRVLTDYLARHPESLLTGKN